MNDICRDVYVIRLCGKEAIKYMRKQIKENRRKRLLLRLIKAVRQLRRQLDSKRV